MCDAPAKSFVKQIKGHTSYNSCSKCTIRGTYSNKSMSFNTLNDVRRKDSEFGRQANQNHHIGISPLLEVYNLNMINNFVIDPMHCTCSIGCV